MLQTLKRIPINPDGSFEEIAYAASIGDEVLAQITLLPALESLDLTHTVITQAALKSLSEMQKLRSVTITGRNVSPDSLKEIRAAIQRRSPERRRGTSWR